MLRGFEGALVFSTLQFNETSPDWSFLLEIFRFEDEDDYEYENFTAKCGQRQISTKVPNFIF